MKRKFLYSESRLAEVTGLSRAQLKTCRIKGAYRKGKGKGGPVELLEAGVQSVLEKYGIKDANLDGARLKRSGENHSALSQEQSTPTSTQGYPHNPVHICGTCAGCGGEMVWNVPRLGPNGGFVHKATARYECSPAINALPDLKLVHVSQLVPNKRILRAQNGTGEIYDVIVPSSEVFAMGDPLRIKPSQQHQGYWQLSGKAPRWRGDRIYRHEFV